jgi:protein SCO1
MQSGKWFRTFLVFAVTSMAAYGYADNSSSKDSLARIGAAPGFTLTTQEKTELSLADMRGNSVVVTFIFTSCRSACPRLTSKLVGIQRRLSKNVKPSVRFVAISVAP